MAETIIFAHMAETTLALGCTTTATSLNLVNGALFPSPGANEYCVLTMENALRQFEIVKCTARAGNVVTVVRAQEGTVALSFNAGDYIGLRLTKGSLDAIKAEAVAAAKAGAFPIGSYGYFSFESIPDDYLACDGAAYSRATCAGLYAKIGDTYGAGDGVNTFNVPDKRGYFDRCWAPGASKDPDKSIRVGGDHAGSTQTSAILDHPHEIYPTASSGGGSGYGGGQIATYNGVTFQTLGLLGPAEGGQFRPTAGGFHTNQVSVHETRPVNMNTLCCIKWR